MTRTKTTATPPHVPSKLRRSPLTGRTTVRMTAEQARDIDAAARRLGLSRADFMRHVAVVAARADA